MDSLATKGLAAYLIAGHFALRAHVDATDARNTPALGTPCANNVHRLWEAPGLDQRVPLCDAPIRRKMTRIELLLVGEETTVRNTARMSLRAQVSEVLEMVGVSP